MYTLDVVCINLAPKEKRGSGDLGVRDKFSGGLVFVTHPVLPAGKLIDTETVTW